MPTSPYRNVALFTALAAVWGSSFMAIKAGLEFLPPVLFAAFRYDIAGALLLVYAVAAGGQWRPSSRREWSYILLNAALLIGVHFTLLFTGQQYVSSAVAAVVLSLTPVLTPVFAWLLLDDERLSSASALGTLLGLLGVTIVAQLDPGNLGAEFYGIVFLFFSAASFALGSVLTQRMRATLPLVPMQGWVMFLGALMLHLISPLLGESTAAVRWTPEAVGALAYLSLVAGIGGFLVYFDLLDRLGSVEISLVNYAVPVFAALSGWLVLGERIAGTTVLGFLVIALGFALVKQERLRAEARVLRARVNDSTLRTDGGREAGSDVYCK